MHSPSPLLLLSLPTSAQHTSVSVMIRVALCTGGRLRCLAAMVSGEYDASDDSGVVKCGEERERVFRAILKSSSQDTIDSSLDLCTKDFRQEKGDNPGLLTFSYL